MSRMIPPHSNWMPNSSIEEDLSFTLLHSGPAVPLAVAARSSRLGPAATPPPKKDSPTDPEVLQKANDIIKDKSADCKPRDV